MQKMGLCESEFLQNVTDTRNYYSHFLRNEASRIDNEGKKASFEFTFHFHLLYFTIRIFLLEEMIGINPCKNSVESYLGKLDNWIDKYKPVS